MAHKPPRPISNHRQASNHWGVASGFDHAISNNHTPGSGAAAYAVLTNDTPVECKGGHGHAGTSSSQLPPTLPMPTVVGPAANGAQSSSAYNSIPILGGSGVGVMQHPDQSGFGSLSFASSRIGGGQRSSFMPSSSVLGASGFNPGMTSGVRPSRQMNKDELTELRDYLWKGSMSIGVDGKARFSSQVTDKSSAASQASGKVSFYNQQFDTMRCTESQTGDDDVAFMPLPRESVALMVDAVRTSTLADDDKCRFLFEMFDMDHKGVLTKDGVRAFVEATFAANGVEFLGAFDYDAVVDKVFAHTRNPDTLTYNEFKKVFGSALTESDDQKSRTQLQKLGGIPEDQQEKKTNEVNAYAEARPGFWGRRTKFYRMYRGEIFWVFMYLALMVGVFIAKASRFGYDPAVKYCPRIAKGFAEICMVNTMFVLLPMCRNFITAIRTSSMVVKFLPVDQHIEFHKICGIVMLIAGLGHTAAWLMIVYYVRTVPFEVWRESKYYHLGFVRDENLLAFALRIPVWTGVVMVLCGAIAAPLCFPKFRRKNFNAFFLAHMLLIPFIALMMLHGVAAWVAAPQAYFWIAPPILIYLIEKRYRMAHVFGGRTAITNVQLSKEAVAIFMKKPKTFAKRQRFQPGMYLFVNVPSISKFEWHPFTISSAPEDKFLSLHIRKAGDWTGALYAQLGNLKEKYASTQLEAQGGRSTPFPYVYLDGPHGAPAQDYTRYREVVLIGAGIGVTPFASILRSIMHQWESYRCEHCKHVRFPPSFQLRKIYFYWITREQEALTWFTNTMNQLSEMDTENRLEIHNYFTSVKNKSVIAPLQALQNFIYETEGEDIISGLHTNQTTHFGRPDWKAELERVASNHRRFEPLQEEEEEDDDREEIGVFFCGPKPLGDSIHNQCAMFNQSKVRWTPDVMFDFHSENF